MWVPLPLAAAATALVGVGARTGSDRAVAVAVQAAEAIASASPRSGPQPEAPADLYDDEAIARRVLGDAWDRLTGPQQSELRILIGRVARNGFHWAQKQPADARVVWVHEGTPRGERIVDVVVEGSSLTKNYGRQLQRMLEDPSKGYGFAVERLKRKIAAAA